MQLSELRFTDLDLPEPLQRGIADCGFVNLTPVQAAALPLALMGKDVAAQAQTGSGKTAAFLIPIFRRFLNVEKPGTKGICPRAIVITPTRELAVQVHRDALAIGRHLPFRSLAVYGGIDYRKQRDDLAAGVDLLIGTPGRLIDYLKQHVYHLKDLEVAVIDEADRMFDMGFIADVRFMFRRMSPFDRRQSFLFSATLGYRVVELSYEHMNNATLVEIEPEKLAAERIEQVLYHVGAHEKFRLFLGLLLAEDWTKAIVFVNTKRQAEILHERLERNGHPCAVLSGDVDQAKRLKILKRFMEGEVRILIATDVASRGLHVEGISHVFNYDVPQDPEDYVHRIGRTARAGAAGKAITLACEHYVLGLEGIEALLGHQIPVVWAGDELYAEEVPRPKHDRDDHLDARPRGDRRGGGPKRGPGGGGRPGGRRGPGGGGKPGGGKPGGGKPGGRRGGGR